MNWGDPFEIDLENRPHLYAHQPYGEEDLYDLLVHLPRLVEADTEKGPADWFLVGMPPGCDPLLAPLAPPHSGDARKVRPIGIYEASGETLVKYNQLLAEGGNNYDN